MPLYEPTIPTRYTEPLIEAMRRDPPPWLEGVLAAAGLDDAILRDPGATLTMASFDALLSSLARHTGRDDLGFDLGLRITPQHHGALAEVLMRCTTLDDLLRLLVRYFRLISPSFFLHYRRNATRGEFIWRPAAAMSPSTLRAIQEVVAVSFHMQISAAIQGKLERYDVYLSMPSPGHVARYRELLPARFHFGHLPLPEVRVVVGKALLETPLRWDVPDQAAATDLVRLQRGIRRTSRWSEWVRMMLREAEGTRPTLELLGELLSVSPRTLVRKLGAEGHTLRDLAKQVRHQRACELLQDPGQSVTQIAHRLGYGDATNFSHAFRAAAGMGPRQYRADNSS